MNFDILKSATTTWQRLKQLGRARFVTSEKGSWLTPKQLNALLAGAKETCEREWQQTLADAHAAAASGEGPQPWDRDWIEHQADLSDGVLAIAATISWHRTQDLLDVLDWALASPQGQRALAMREDANSPWQETLEMLEELRPALLEASLQMLNDRARSLSSAGCSQAGLEDALEELE